jgi:hypothetical protein
LFVYTDVFYPPSLTSVPWDLSYNPSILTTNPPVFSAALSFYSVAVAQAVNQSSRSPVRTASSLLNPLF